VFGISITSVEAHPFIGSHFLDSYYKNWKKKSLITRAPGLNGKKINNSKDINNIIINI
jgi:hypothetical protein